MRTLEWKDESEFELEGVKFRSALGDYAEKSSAERFVLLKDRGSLALYSAVLAGDLPKNILEFGIFQGGSPALFSLWFDVQRFVGIDICKPVAAFDEFCRTHPIGQRIRSYYETSQADEQKIKQIVQTEFGKTPLDAIIDDASHHYDYSRRTFEITFPLLRPGGAYVIEDWGWAHWPHFKLDSDYQGSAPLSKLVMELLMLCASRSDLISEVRVFPQFVFVRKCKDAPPMETLSLDSAYLKRNIEICDIKNTNLAGIVRLLRARVAHRAHRRFTRTKEKLRRIFMGKRKV